MANEDVMIANRISDLKPTAINRILAEVRALSTQGRKVVSLMRGEPDFPTPRTSWKPRTQRYTRAERIIPRIAANWRSAKLSLRSSSGTTESLTIRHPKSSLPTAQQ